MDAIDTLEVVAVTKNAVQLGELGQSMLIVEVDNFSYEKFHITFTLNFQLTLMKEEFEK